MNQNQLFLWVLIFQFWLSGLWVLGVMFLNIQNLQTLTICTFGAYALGSFVSGLLADQIGRKYIFVFSSCLLFLSSIILFWNLWAGLIMANLCIGPLNNLTFIYLNENKQLSHERNFVYVLLGWAFSEITLGLLFLLISDSNILLIILCICTCLFTISSIYLTNQTEQYIKLLKQRKNKNQKKQFKEIFIPNQLRPLIGGCVIMFLMQMFYYRTQFTLDIFGISLQVNTIIVGCTQALANISLGSVLPKFKRNLTLKILLICLMLLLLGLILTSDSVIQSVVQGIMRFVDTCIMLVLGVYLPQLFSPNEKARGLNYIMSFGVFGSALSGKIFSHLQFAYLQIFLGAAFITTFLLHQTKNMFPKNLQSIQQYQSIKI